MTSVCEFARHFAHGNEKFRRETHERKRTVVARACAIACARSKGKKRGVDRRGDGSRAGSRARTSARRERAEDMGERAHTRAVIDDREGPPMRVKIATAGAMSSGKTALVRRFFVEARTRAGEDASASDWRATPTIGMDFGTMRIDCDKYSLDSKSMDDSRATNVAKVVRGCFFDPSGAEAHAPCRREAYRDADGIVLVIDTHRRASEIELEGIIREIASARSESLVDAVRVLVVRAKTRSAPARPSRAAAASELPLQDPDSELALLRHRLNAISLQMRANTAEKHREIVRFVTESDVPEGESVTFQHLAPARSPRARIIDTDASTGLNVLSAFAALASTIVTDRARARVRR